MYSEGLTMTSNECEKESQNASILYFLVKNLDLML